MARVSAYHNPHPLPSVNQMMVAGGEGYQDVRTMYPLFPSSPMSRIQTPVVRVGASLRLSTDITPGDRGRMWCR